MISTNEFLTYCFSKESYDAIEDVMNFCIISKLDTSQIFIDAFSKMDPQFCLGFLNYHETTKHRILCTKIASWFALIYDKELCLQNAQTETFYRIAHRDFEPDMQGISHDLIPYVIQEPWCLEYAENNKCLSSYMNYCTFEQACEVLKIFPDFNELGIYYNKSFTEQQVEYIVERLQPEATLIERYCDDFQHALMQRDIGTEYAPASVILKFHPDPESVFLKYHIQPDPEMMYIGKNCMMPEYFIKYQVPEYNGISIWSPATAHKFTLEFQQKIWVWLRCLRIRKHKVPKFLKIKIIQLWDHCQF